MDQIDLLGHAFLDSLLGIYSNGVDREDSQYSLLGRHYGESGSSLADLTDPTQAYRLSPDTTNRQNDIPSFRVPRDDISKWSIG